MRLFPCPSWEVGWGIITTLLARKGGQEGSRGLTAAKDPSGLCWEGLEGCRQTWVLLPTPAASGKRCAHSHMCSKKPEGTTRR